MTKRKVNKVVIIPTHNNFLTSAHAMGALELKVLLGAASMLESHGVHVPGGRWIHCNISELDDLIGIGKHNYKHLDEIASEIHKITIMIKDSKPKSKNFHSFAPIPEIKYEDGRLSVFFLETALPYFLELTGNYTNLLVDTYKKIREKYEMRIYGLLSLWNSRGEKEFEITAEELRIMLTDPIVEEKIQKIVRDSQKQNECSPSRYQSEQYKKHNLLFMDGRYLKRQLDSAKKQLDGRSDLSFEYETENATRSKKINVFKFKIIKKAVQTTMLLPEHDSFKRFVEDIRELYKDKPITFYEDVLCSMNSAGYLCGENQRPLDRLTSLKIYDLLYSKKLALLDPNEDMSTLAIRQNLIKLPGIVFKAYDKESDDADDVLILSAEYNKEDGYVLKIQNQKNECLVAKLQADKVEKILELEKGKLA